MGPYQLKPGTVLQNRYLIGRVLGEGGFGITYIGLDKVLTKRVAVKEFYPAGAAHRASVVSDGVIITRGKEPMYRKGVERFVQEARSLAAFSSEDGIVDVLDTFQANNTAYIVMEYLEGDTLKTLLKTKGVFDATKLIKLMEPVMKSLSVMHRTGFIHRDISPDNIMLTNNGRLKLMDFGSARYFLNQDSELSVMLKQGYAPVEQYSSRSRIQCSAILCDPTDKADIPDTEFYLHCRFSYQHFEPKYGFTRCFLAFEYIEQQRSRSRAEVTCPEIQCCYRRRIHIKIYAVIE